jgi:hypothetical protein
MRSWCEKKKKSLDMKDTCRPFEQQCVFAFAFEKREAFLLPAFMWDLCARQERERKSARGDVFSCFFFLILLPLLFFEEMTNLSVVFGRYWRASGLSVLWNEKEALFLGLEKTCFDSFDS